MRAAAAALLLLLLSSLASLAQSSVNVIGFVTPGHCVSFFSTTQIQDSGSACGGGGGGVPGGATTQLQYNNAGAFGGIAGATTDGTVTTFGNSAVALLGSSTGVTTFASANAGASNFTMTVPATTDTLAVLGTPQTFTAPQTFAITQTIASATAANWRNIFGAGATTTITGNTGSPITALYAAEIAQPTLTDSSAVTVTNAATLFIGGPPLAAGSVTISNAWAIRVGAGNVSFPGAGNVLGTITSGTWNGSLIGLSFGGTNNALTASAGGIVWSDASKLNILAGTSTAGLCLLSGNLATPAWTACPGGAPGGANTNVQFNNSGAFGGDSGFTYAGTGQATLALGTITTNNKALSITGTWNAAGTAFDAPLLMNVTNTASAVASALFDFQQGGTSLLILQPKTNSVLSLGGAATPAGFRVYNTVDTLSGPTNFERGVFDWTTTANTLTIANQSGGSGNALRALTVQAAGQLNLNYGGGADFQLAGASGATAMFLSQGGTANLRIQVPLYLSGTDLAISKSAVSVLAIGSTGTVGNTGGWLNYAGQTRVTSDFSVTSSTVLVNVTGLSVSVQAGRTYQFEAELYVTDAAAGGVQAAIAGTATATAINYTGYVIADNAIKAKTNATALATAVGSTVTTETSGIIVRIAGTITVNVAGTLTVQMAQNTSNATPTVAKAGSWFVVQDIK